MDSERPRGLPNLHQGWMLIAPLNCHVAIVSGVVRKVEMVEKVGIVRLRLAAGQSRFPYLQLEECAAMERKRAESRRFAAHSVVVL